MESIRPLRTKPLHLLAVVAFLSLSHALDYYSAENQDSSPETQDDSEAVEKLNKVNSLSRLVSGSSWRYGGASDLSQPLSGSYGGGSVPSTPSGGYGGGSGGIGGYGPPASSGDFGPPSARLGLDGRVQFSQSNFVGQAALPSVPGYQGQSSSYGGPGFGPGAVGGSCAGPTQGFGVNTAAVLPSFPIQNFAPQPSSGYGGGFSGGSPGIPGLGGNLLGLGGLLGGPAQPPAGSPLRYALSAYGPVLPEVDFGCCYTRYTDTQLFAKPPARYDPYFTWQGIGLEECLALCAASRPTINGSCEAINYIPKTRDCQIFNASARSPPAQFLMKYGFDYYEPTGRAGCQLNDMLMGFVRTTKAVVTQQTVTANTTRVTGSTLNANETKITPPSRATTKAGSTTKSGGATTKKGTTKKGTTSKTGGTTKKGTTSKPGQTTAKGQTVKPGDEGPEKEVPAATAETPRRSGGAGVGGENRSADQPLDDEDKAVPVGSGSGEKLTDNNDKAAESKESGESREGEKEGD